MLRNYRTLFFLALTWLLGARPAFADDRQVTLVSGDFPPYVQENSPSHGVMARIVTAAFAIEGVSVQLVFRPWERGREEARRGLYLGTFPYLPDPQRQRDFAYSQSFYQTRERLWVRQTVSQPAQLRGGALCLPLGYVSSLAGQLKTQLALRVETGPSMDTCIRMLRAGRVDAVPLDQAVGDSLIGEDFGPQSGLHALPLAGAKANDNYLIISHQHPDYPQWIALFNRGLARIRRNGIYANILAGADLQ